MAAAVLAALSAEEMSAMWASVDDLLAQKLVSRGLNRGEYSRDLDKAGLLKCHMVAAQEYQRMLDIDPGTPRVHHLMELQRDDIPLESLEKMEKISLDTRVLNSERGDTFTIQSRHALYGRLCATPYKTGGVHTVLEDSYGRAIPVVIHHAASASDYPAGMLVAIKQPCFKTLTLPDRCVGVMVDNPTHLVNLSAGRVPADAESTFGCSDVIGPVQIALGKDEHNNGRRGLFATREVKHGEVILRTVPLTRGKKRSKQSMLGLIMHGQNIDTSTPLPERIIPSTMQELIANALKVAQEHPRCSHMLSSLALADSPTKSIPPMALFDPSVKGRYDPLPLDIGRVRRTIATNVAGTGGTGDAEASAVYALPSFMNHDCDPNCGVSYDGEEQEIQIVRTSGTVPAGGELCLGYWDVRRTWHFRQSQSRDLHFSCSCRRCLFEERLARSSPRFKQLSKQWHDINEAHLVKPKDVAPGEAPPRAKAPSQASSAMLRDEVENMLRRAKMTPQQQEWIRKSFSQQVAGVRAFSSSSMSSERRANVRLTVRPSSTVSLGARVHVHHSSMLSAFLPKRMSLWRPVLKLLP